MVRRGLDVLRTHRYFSAVTASFLFMSLPSQTTVILADAVTDTTRCPSQKNTPLNLTLCFIHLHYAAAVSFTDCYPDVQCYCSLCVTDKIQNKAVRQRCLSTLSNCLSSCDIDGLNNDTYCIGWQISTHNFTYKHQNTRWSGTNIPLPVGLAGRKQVVHVHKPVLQTSRGTCRSQV